MFNFSNFIPYLEFLGSWNLLHYWYAVNDKILMNWRSDKCHVNSFVETFFLYIYSLVSHSRMENFTISLITC